MILTISVAASALRLVPLSAELWNHKDENIGIISPGDEPQIQSQPPRAAPATMY